MDLSKVKQSFGKVIKERLASNLLKPSKAQNKFEKRKCNMSKTRIGKAVRLQNDMTGNWRKNIWHIRKTKERSLYAYLQSKEGVERSCDGAYKCKCTQTCFASR